MEKFVHGGNVYAPIPTGTDWLDFSANINPLGLCPKVKATILDNLDRIVNYPDPQGAELKTAIGQYHRLAAENIVLGNGAAELFYVFFHARQKGSIKRRKILLPVPSFSEYERAALAAGMEVDYFPIKADNGFFLDINSLKAAAKGHDYLVLGNPNNPTGNLIGREEISDLLAAVSQAIILVDESFLDFLPDDAAYSVRDLAAKCENLIVISSLTKFYAIPGLRLGFGVMNGAFAREMELNKDPWNVNLLAQKAGAAALKAADYQKATREFVKEEKNWLAGELKKIGGMKIFPPSVNFILLEISGFPLAERAAGKSGPLSSAEFAAALRHKGILVRDCANYPRLGNSYIRLAVRRREENEKLLAAIREMRK